MIRVVLFAALFALALAISFALAGDVPDRDLTPGVIRSDVNNVCAVKWGLDARHVTPAMKRQVFESYGITCKPLWPNGKERCGDYEIDHFVSRELGGADDVRNLWPQSFKGEWNARVKDRLENRLHKEVCDGTITLQQAQDEIIADWREAWQRRFGDE